MNYSQPKVKNSSRCSDSALNNETDEVIIVRVNDFYFTEIPDFQVNIFRWDQDFVVHIWAIKFRTPDEIASLLAVDEYFVGVSNFSWFNAREMSI